MHIRGIVNNTENSQFSILFLLLLFTVFSIRRLHEQRLLRLKGAIFFVARKFNCSTATIYRYLSEITS
ncbi:helix-turn-helix domain-containing protein [Blautia sp. HCP3S3_G3]|uniref:helix-turn-helix domain-containing protein n=1 Tax=Blautia sp. HCP3S3_G3 TaxID=3438913 RepID=UPI003F8A4227